MTALKDQLHALAEQLAGELVFIDVVYTIRTAGSPTETTGTTAEAALARFIAEILEADAEGGTGPTAAPAAVITAPPPPPPPTNGNGHKPTQREAAAANRQQIAALAAQGLAAPAIAEQTGINLSNVYYHLAELRKQQPPQPQPPQEAAPPDAPAPFRAG